MNNNSKKGTRMVNCQFSVYLLVGAQSKWPRKRMPVPCEQIWRKLCLQSPQLVKSQSREENFQLGFWYRAQWVDCSTQFLYWYTWGSGMQFSLTPLFQQLASQPAGFLSCANDRTGITGAASTKRQCVFPLSASPYCPCVSCRISRVPNLHLWHRSRNTKLPTVACVTQRDRSAVYCSKKKKKRVIIFTFPQLQWHRHLSRSRSRSLRIHQQSTVLLR